ncbi:MAG: class I SAM-dependent methyltransferase [Bdellovibrionales bacterium]
MISEYQLIDCGDFEKLERIGTSIIRRPSPQAVWGRDRSINEWETPCTRYLRRPDGNGDWVPSSGKAIPDYWDVEHFGVRLRLRCTGFGHVGGFFEQGPNWDQFRELISKRSNEEYRVLNLFAYTGGATVACAQAGASVVHLDASKTSVTWAKENADLNQLENASIRYITDDVKTFVDREIRRNNKYEAIILDPPSFGRGTKKQVWKIEEDMVPLLDKLTELMSDKFHFLSLSSHSQGYTPIALENLTRIFGDGTVESKEMTVPFKSCELSSGATTLWIKK